MNRTNREDGRAGTSWGRSQISTILRGQKTSIQRLDFQEEIPMIEIGYPLDLAYSGYIGGVGALADRDIFTELIPIQFIPS